MRKWIAAVAAAAVAVSAAGSLWLMSGAKAAPAISTPSSSQVKDETAYDAAERFLRQLGKGQFRQAYETAVPELKAKLSLPEFIKEVEIFERVGLQTVAWTQTGYKHQFMAADPVKGLRWNVTELTFKGDLATRGGRATLQFAWINEAGSWQMQYFRWESQPVQTSRAR